MVCFQKAATINIDKWIKRKEIITNRSEIKLAGSFTVTIYCFTHKILLQLIITFAKMLFEFQFLNERYILACKYTATNMFRVLIKI